MARARTRRCRARCSRRRCRSPRTCSFILRHSSARSSPSVTRARTSLRLPRISISASGFAFRLYDHAGVRVVAGVRADHDQPLAVGEEDDRRGAPLAGAATGRGQQQYRGSADLVPQSAATEPVETHVELACCGERRTAASPSTGACRTCCRARAKYASSGSRKRLTAQRSGARYDRRRRRDRRRLYDRRMSDQPVVLYEVADRVARITLNRPERGNGITPALVAELVECVRPRRPRPGRARAAARGRRAGLLRRL